MIRSFHLMRGFVIMAMLVVITAMASPVMAAQGKTWLPAYKPGTHVYIDPQLANHPSAPVAFPGLEAQITQLEERHGLKVFVIATEMGADIEMSDVPARDGQDMLVSKWQSASGFPAEDYLIVFWARRADNPNKGSVAAIGGNRFSDWNMLGGYFSDKVNGPITKNLRLFMPQNPQGAIVAIVETVNADIDVVKAREVAEQERQAREKMMPYFYAGGGGTLLVIIIFGILFFRSSARKKKAKALIDKWTPLLDTINQNYMKLRGSYMGFLTEQSDWKSKYRGKTLIAYTKACKDFSDFSVRRKRAGELLAAAKKAFDGGGLLGVKGYQEVIDLLQDRTVTITGDDLPIEEATLFGGLVEKADYKPQGLLDAMSELFDATNKALAGIVAAFRGAQQNKVDVERLSATVDKTRADIAAAELTMEPYEGTIRELKQGQSTFVANLVGDPLEAFAGSEAVEAGFEALEKRLRRAISLKGSLPAVKTTIDGTEEKATRQRGQNAVYLYPLGDGETVKKEALPPRFLLKEVNGNPDPIVSDARAQLKSAHQLVFDGKLDESQKARDEATRLAGSASALIDDIIAAKALVEKNVPPARTTLASLDSEIEPAQTALDELISDFVPENIVGEADKLKRANAAQDATPGHLARVKELYDGQNYLAARALIRSTQATLDGSRTELTQVHARLKELRRLRQDSRDTLATCQTKVRQLTVKFRENAFTTSAATDSAFATASERLATLNAECDKKVANWVRVNAAMHEVNRSFDGFDSAIDTQARSYSEAKAQIKALERAIESAEPEVSNTATTQGTRTALSTVNTTFGALGRRINTAKSDWEAIERDAKAATKAAGEVEEAAKAEIQARKDAVSLIETAKDRIDEVDRHSYGWGVEPDLSAARTNLRQANDALSSKNYDNAKAEARAAKQSADKAHKDAEDEADDRKDAAARAAAAALAKANKKDDDGPRIGGGGGLPRIGGGGGNRPTSTPQVRSSTGGGRIQSRGGGDNY